ncbi:MAG: YgiQ family radical SAM protein [Clostridia bacterium]|nr:YgiQ family radical SAM protein [Clostridia bacterium]
MQSNFLPISQQDMKQQHIEQLDFVYVIGDAYVDHPSFGPAVISRHLEANGYKVGIIAQPDWKNDHSIAILGEPRLGFLVSSGNMDSMVNHYYVSKKRRKTDAYSPGGRAGLRPDYAVTVYSNLIRKSYPGKPIIIGGIEASLRRMAHYDYWSNKLKRSVLLDSSADLLSYGMGERSIIEIADALNSGIAVKDLTFIKGTVYKTRDLEHLYDYIELPDYSVLSADKEQYARSFMIQYQNTDAITAKALAEHYPDQNLYVVQNPPVEPLSTIEMDDIYQAPYCRTYHPVYEKDGGIPAITEIKFSLTSSRGCFGGCSFCALTFHQGRRIQSRSHDSLIQEAMQICDDKDFKGYIHDVGGPTANFRQPACQKQVEKGVCMNKQCLFPSACKNLIADHSDYSALLHKLRALPNVKKVFIRSGIRYDYLMLDPNKQFFKELVKYHISGQLKVAPEHISPKVLKYMGKPSKEVYDSFCRQYERLNKQEHMNQFLVPYVMSSHPGSTMKEAVELAEYMRDLGYMPEQVQDFYPTPSTLSTVMYYTGLDPRTMEPVYVPRDPHEKNMQRALIQYRNPANYDLVYEALQKADRLDLIGFGPKCLIRPRNGSYHAQNRSSNKQSKNTDQENKNTDQQNKTTNKQNKKATNYKRTIRNVHKKK